MILAMTAFVGCGNTPAPQITAIKTAETLNIDDTGINLPEIILEYDNGKTEIAPANDFWFNAEYVYVQDGLVKVKSNSPSVFDDELTITHKKNDKLTIKVTVHKIYVPLQSLALTTENGKTRCPAGSNIQMMPIFTPSNATDRNVTYEIANGHEYAAIALNGLLSIDDEAISGDVIEVVVLNGDIVSSVFTITVAMPTVTQSVVVFDAAEPVTDKGDTYTEFFAFDEIDLYKLKQQGYEDIQFSFKIEAKEIKSGYSDIYLDLQKKNGGIWCIYRSEGYFVIGDVGWTDYSGDGYGASTWGYFADDTRETNISITKLIQDCGAVPSIRLSCGASGPGKNEWTHGYSTITISIS
jgi:hypothetical protein